MSGYAVSKRDDTLIGTTTSKKDSSKSDSKVDENNKNLPAIYNEKNLSVVSASQVLAHNFPSSYSSENYQKALAELKLVLIGIVGFVFLAYVGATIAMQINFVEGSDIIYNSGLIGGCLMLVALIYFIIKRVKMIRRHLKSEMWYYLHIVCGALGAYLVLLHTSFDLRSVNGTISLITTFVVIVSGALGRYLFTLSTISLHRQYVDIRDTEQDLFDLIDKYECDSSLRIRERISKYALYCFNKPRNTISYFARWASVVYLGIYYYSISKFDLRKISKNMSEVTSLPKKDIEILKRYQKKKLQLYILHIIKMGYTSLVEQVLRHWRMLHIPALYLLIVTAFLHVVVIHMY